MSNIIELHPSVRENREPRMSAASLAEYLIMKPDQQETVLHNSRFASPPAIVPYQGALRPIRAFCADPNRPQALLETAKESLKVKAADLSTRPKAREESLRCIETIELFQRAENAFGIGKLPTIEAPRFPPIGIHGVELSVQPDVLVQRQGKDGQLIGVIMFRPQKAPDPDDCRLEATRRERGDHRREMARYMLAMAQLMMERQGQTFGQFDRDRSFVADIRLGERIEFSSGDHMARVRAINAACKQIGQLWAGIEPRKSVIRK